VKTSEKKLSRHLLGVAAGFFLLLGTGAGAGLLWWNNAIAPQGSGRSVTVQIPEGASADEIGRQLQTVGLIRSLPAWKLWVRLASTRGGAGGFQAGTYELSPQASLPALAEVIWTGKVKQASFTIPEGWSLKQMATYFEQQGWFSAGAFLKVTTQVPYERFPWLPANLPHLEGFLFPDTYQVPIEQRSDPAKVVNTMLKHFERQALPLYQQRQGFPDMGLQDWVTLSSIVEKEAVVPQERSRIAGVFWNRLRKEMALGSDPTVEYGLGIRQTEDQPLTFSQVKTPTPYNTYINPGLTPTPIASPGLASLKAVLDPEQTDYLYFVARYDGTHVFSKTLAEHEQAQSKIWDHKDAQQSQNGQT
jgi:UPF0755 protein